MFKNVRDSVFSTIFHNITLDVNEKKTRSETVLARGGGGGYSQKNLVGVCGPLPETLTLFMTKICDIPYPIFELTKNSKANL